MGRAPGGGKRGLREEGGGRERRMVVVLGQVSQGREEAGVR